MKSERSEVYFWEILSHLGMRFNICDYRSCDFLYRLRIKMIRSSAGVPASLADRHAPACRKFRAALIPYQFLVTINDAAIIDVELVRIWGALELSVCWGKPVRRKYRNTRRRNMGN